MNQSFKMSRLSSNPNFEKIVLDEVYKVTGGRYGSIYTIKVSHLSDVIQTRGKKISIYDITMLDNDTYEEIVHTKMCVTEFPAGHDANDFVFIAPKSEIMCYRMEVFELDNAHEYIDFSKAMMLITLKLDCERQQEFMLTVKNAAAVDVEC